MQLDNMFLQACKNNRKSVVQTFLKRGGIDVNKRDESGNTPLIYACLKNARDLVKMLLEKQLRLKQMRIWEISGILCLCILRQRREILRSSLY